MSKYCVNCGGAINPLRLKALPGTKQCVGCSNTSRVAGVQIITGKTTYSSIQVVDQDTANDFYKKQERRGLVSNGIKFRK